MPLIDFIGYCAAFLTTASFVPQAWHTFQTRDVRCVSLGMYSVFTAGVACWLVYGALLAAWPIRDCQFDHAGPGGGYFGDEAEVSVNRTPLA